MQYLTFLWVLLAFTRFGIQPRRLNDRIPHHTGVSALVGIGEKPVLSTHHKWLNSTLCTIICEFQPTIEQKTFQLNKNAELFAQNEDNKRVARQRVNNEPKF